MALTAKQQAFCGYFVECNNAKEAAIKAGYEVNSAKVSGCRNITKDNCKEVISRLSAEWLLNGQIERTRIAQDGLSRTDLF